MKLLAITGLRLLLGAFVFGLMIKVTVCQQKFDQVGAYPENVFTAGGQWGHHVHPLEMERWKRTEFGVPWAWFVLDEGTKNPSWSARLEARYLIFYLGLAWALSVAVVVVGARRR